MKLATKTEVARMARDVLYDFYLTESQKVERITGMVYMAENLRIDSIQLREYLIQARSIESGDDITWLNMSRLEDTVMRVRDAAK